MNFLEIAKRVRQEVGYSGDGPPSVTGQTGAYQKVVSWVQSAAQDIHQSREQWRFDWARFVAPLAPGQASIDLAQQCGLQVRSLAPEPVHVYRTSQGPHMRYWLAQLPWEEFRQMPSSPAPGMPTYCALAPDGALHLHPVPVDDLTLVLDYYCLPPVLKENLDIPRIPAQYHMAIVWSAVSMAAGHDENMPLMQMADKRHKDVMAKMERTELPALSASLEGFA